MSKTVLVSFKERNKVLRVSTSTNEQEIACLKEQFFHAFNETITEGQLIVFQRYDSEWDSFVDLEEHDTVENRDKLKAVIIEKTGSSINTGSVVNTETSASHLAHNELEHLVSTKYY